MSNDEILYKIGFGNGRHTALRDIQRRLDRDPTLCFEKGSGRECWKRIRELVKKMDEQEV